MNRIIFKRTTTTTTTVQEVSIEGLPAHLMADPEADPLVSLIKRVEELADREGIDETTAQFLLLHGS